LFYSIYYLYFIHVKYNILTSIMLIKKIPSAFTAFLLLVSLFQTKAKAQAQYELNTGWKCDKAADVHTDGTLISKSNFAINAWQNATVPGTVLTTQLNNKQVPDPFYGMNNERIPDIYKTGRDYYTYWFVKDFKEAQPQNSNQVYLNFRGVNYSCDVF